MVRSFQHAVLGSQTIGDLYEALPCPSNDVPPESDTEVSISLYKEGAIAPHRGAVICIEGVCYGDGQSEEDYSRCVLSRHYLVGNPFKA